MKILPIELAGQELMAEVRKFPTPPLSSGFMAADRLEQFIFATVAAINDLRQQVAALQQNREAR